MNDGGSVQKYLVEMQERVSLKKWKIRHIHSAKAANESKDTYNAWIIGSIACGIPANAEEYAADNVFLCRSASLAEESCAFFAPAGIL